MTYVTLLICGQVAADTGPEQDEFLGGPDSVGWGLESDADLEMLGHFERWMALKDRLREVSGFDFGLDYAALYQQANSSPFGDDHAASGVLRLYGKWTALGHGTQDTGKLVWKVEHRHQIGENNISPSSLAGNLGYVGVTGISFNDAGGFLGPLYWEQMFRRENSTIGFVLGRLDPLDFVDISGYSSQWRRFQNPSTAANSALFFPDLGFGAGAGFTSNDQWAFGATIHDANGQQNEYDFFGGGSEFYTTGYVSWAPSRKQRFEREIHLTAWHVDERTDRGSPDGWGLSFAANWLTGNCMPFLRLGWSEGGAARADKAIVFGTLYRPGNNIGEIGLAWNWESMSNDALGEQQVVEAFLRWEPTENIEITPSFQLLIDPALNPDENLVPLFGLRTRITF